MVRLFKNCWCYYYFYYYYFLNPQYLIPESEILKAKQVDHSGVWSVEKVL